MAPGCLLKTFAFISALMSVAVLVSSLVVLISAIACVKLNDETDYGNSSQRSNDSAPIFPLVNYNIDEDNGTVVETLEIPVVPIMTTFPWNSTNSSAPLNENDEKKNMSVDLSTSMSPSPAFPSSNTSRATTTVSDSTDGGLVESSDSTTASTPTQAPWNAFSEHQHDFWKAKPDTYIILMQASSGTGVFAALLQLGFSWLLICGSAKDLKDRTTLWNLSNFIVLILVVVIILVPLSYNSASNSFKGSGAFWREIYRKITSVEFSTKTLETIWSSIPNFLTEDVALYYYVLGVDAFILLVLLIPPLVSCFCYPCKRCCCKGKRGRSDSDLMLFGTGTGGGGGSGASGEAY